MDQSSRTLINYYVRKGWHQHIQKLCEEVMDKKGRDTTLIFWRAFAIGMEGSYAEAIRELENLKSKRDVEYACIAALIYMHKKCKLVDHEELSSLEMLQLTAEDRAGDGSLLLCATFYWHIGDYKTANDIITTKLLKGRYPPQTPMQVKAAILKGWIDLTSSDHDDSMTLFQAALEQEEDAEILLGMAKWFEAKKSYKKSLECLDKLIVKYSWFSPSLSEKALIYLKTGEWELCIDTAERALQANKYDIEALRLLILYHLSREGNVETAMSFIKKLLAALDSTEKSNSKLYYEIGKTHARISDNNEALLKQNLKFIDRAIRGGKGKGDADFVAERGYSLALLKDFGAACDAYKEALSIEESHEGALHGLIYCQIHQGELNDASQQMEFLNVIQETKSGDNNSSAAMPPFLEALLAIRVRNDRATQISLLQSSVRVHMDALKQMVNRSSLSTYDLMVAMNPVFLTEVASEFLSTGGGEHSGDTDASAAVAKGIRILEKLIKKSPGFYNAQMLLANAKFMAGDVDASCKIANNVLGMDNRNAEAYLLLARVSLDRGQCAAASTSLEEALAHDFTIRTRPVYHLIKAKVAEAKGDFKDAEEILEAAMKLYKKKKTSKNSSSLRDQASLYIQLAEIYSQLNVIGKATEVVKEALSIFQNTPEEVRILVANSELAIKRNDFSAAIKMLNSVPTTSSAFANAQVVKAEVYLTHRRDKVLYAKCFQTLVDLDPTSSSAYIRLAEAHCRIQNLESAIEAFTTALELNPSDVSLASRIGKILVMMHDYSRAIDYYESALRQAPKRAALRYDLASLYHRLSSHEAAKKVIDTAPPREAGSQDINDRVADVKLFRLKASVLSGLGNSNGCLNALLESQSAQKRVLDMIRGSTDDFAAAQGRVMAEICYEISQYYVNTGDDSTKILQYYNLALRADPSHEASIIELARSYLKTGDLSQCQDQCSTLLRLNPSNEEAAIMLADIMFQKADYESAIHQFRELLADKADNFVALSRFVMMLRRAGKLSEAPKYLNAAAKHNGGKSKHSAGLCYCRGLYNWYRNDILEAIKEFNLARRDGVWGHDSIAAMVEIYLNPDNDNMWEEAEVGARQGENIRIAGSLLNEVPDSARSDCKFRVLQAYILIASKAKDNLETAVTSFLEILEDVDRDYVPALLGLAIAYMLLKQQSKARNQLKRIAKMTYDQTVAEEFEKSYLLLADIYVGRAKYDLAQELCKKALEHNKSSGKAWESLGLIMEKEQSYQDAAEAYERAWECVGEANAGIGFKLGFNYLKAKKHVEAIDVCNKVLTKYPEYPKIKDEILEPAFEGLRP